MDARKRRVFPVEARQSVLYTTGIIRVTNHLYHNNDNGTFTDVTQDAGISNPNGKAMSMAMCDYNNDGYPDIAVACDLTDNMLFRNNMDGTFTDIAGNAGVINASRKAPLGDGHRMRGFR